MNATCQIEQCSKADYDYIVMNLPIFWDDQAPSMRAFHHPMIIHEFGNTAFVIKHQAEIIAYLFGFYAQTGAYAYTHLVAVRQGWRKQGLAKKLYLNFIELARKRGCTCIKAITRPYNARSIAFHTKLGMILDGEPDEHGVPVVKGYGGPDEDRVVFGMGI